MLLAASYAWPATTSLPLWRDALHKTPPATPLAGNALAATGLQQLALLWRGMDAVVLAQLVARTCKRWVLVARLMPWLHVRTQHILGLGACVSRTLMAGHLVLR